MTIFCGDSVRVAHPLFQVEGSGSTPTSPLQLHVGRISEDLAIDLNLLWHSRLPVIAKSNILRTKRNLCLGAEYLGIWYASIILSDPVARAFNDKPWMELRRMAIAPDAPPNTGSRLLKVIVSIIKRRMPEVEKIISYQDESVHCGTIYKAAGWNPTFVGGTSWNNKVRKRIDGPAAGSPKTRWEKALA